MISNEAEKIILVIPISQTHYIVPPLGLGYLATSLRKNGFLEVGILDCIKEKMTFGKFRQFIKGNQPRIVGFQIFSYDFDSAVKSINIVKQESPQSTILIGGPHVSAVGKIALEELDGVDFGFVGEAEVGLPLLLKRLLKEERISWDNIPGLIWREGSNIYMNRRAVIQDLDSLGFPSWDLISPASYPDKPQGGFYRNFPIAPISTSRGCPYPCTFCGSGVNMGRRLRLRSIKSVLEEMDVLYNNFGVREFHIIDDMFNFYRERVVEFCQGLRIRKWNISYTFPNGLRLNQLDKEMLQMMKDTGLYTFTVGIESGSQRILDLMKKKLTLEMIEEKVSLINSIGLEPNGFFIIGFPGESLKDIKDTIRFAKRLRLTRAHFSNFLPLPGTEATEILIEEGEINQPKWSSLFYSEVAYSPKGISKKQLKRLQRKAFLEFYLRPRILFKLICEIKSLTHLKMIIERARDYIFSNNSY